MNQGNADQHLETLKSRVGSIKLKKKMDQLKADREAEPLNRKEIEAAQKLIEREQPLKEIPIWIALPYLKPLKKWLSKCCSKETEETPDADPFN